MDKAVILYGWRDTPDPQLLMKVKNAQTGELYIDYWESYLPFDGLVIPINPTGWTGRYGEAFSERLLPVSQTSLSMSLLLNRDAALSQYQDAIDKLKAIHSRPNRRFTHNFILAQFDAWPNSVNYPFDWTNDEQWAYVIRNVKILARVANDGFCKGLFIDPEQYGPKYKNDPLPQNIFNWLCFRQFKQSTDPNDFKNLYRPLLQARGRSFMEAIVSEFPSCTILTTYALTLVQGDLDKLSKDPGGFWASTCPFVDQTDGPILNNSRYCLMAPFFDGIMSAMSGANHIIDGCEDTYSYETESQYSTLRTFVNDCKTYSMDQATYLRRMEVACAIGIYNEPPSTMNEDHFRFNPKLLQHVIGLAKKYSDKYVWVWPARNNFFWHPSDAEPLIADQAHAAYIMPGPTLPPVTAANSLPDDRIQASQVFTDALRSSELPSGHVNCHIASHTLVVGVLKDEQDRPIPGTLPGISQPFEVPPRFTGHVIVLGNGGNQQAIFLVGSDFDAHIPDAQSIEGGFIKRLDNNPNVPDIGLRTVGETGLRPWQLTGAPDGCAVVVLIGATQ